jgi:uncharacterized protein
LDLTLHLTHRCNLACSYCYALPESAATASRDMSEAVIDAAVALAAGEAQASARGFFTVTFFGGEPLLRRDLVEHGLQSAQRCAAEAGLELSARICTNGLLLDDAALDFCVEHELAVSLSLDGVREAHDAHRVFADGRGSYEATMARLPAILERLPYTTVQLVVTPVTAHLLADSVALLLDQGVRYVLTTLDYTASWTPETMGALATSYDAVATLYEQRTLAEQKFYLACLDAKISSRTKGPVRQHERCTAGQGQVSVAPSGRIYPCVQFVGDDGGLGCDASGYRAQRWALGHVLEGGFDVERRAALAAADGREREGCDGCALAQRCNNWCACLNWQTTGEVDQVSPLQCTHEKLLLGAADRAASQLYKKRAPLFLRKHYDDAHPLLSYLEDMVEGDS